MRRLAGTLVLLCLFTAGCRAGYKSAAGSATSPDGFGKGVKRSVVFNDEAGVFTRALLVGLGMFAAVGSIENPQVKTEVNNVGGNTVVTEERTATIRSGPAEQGLRLIETATDPETRTWGKYGGLGSNLEIASTSLGGDTAGWRFAAGWAFRFARGRKGSGVLLRGFAGLGYGRFSVDDRVLMQTDRGPPRYGDGEAKFFGVPVRFGAFLLTVPRGLWSLKGAETYVGADFNFSNGPSTYTLGERLQFGLFYLAAEVITSRREDDLTFALEGGIGF